MLARGGGAKAAERPHLLFLVAEDWYFVSHRLVLARAASNAGYRVTVATRLSEHEALIREAGIDVVSLPFRRGSLNPIREACFLFALMRLYRRLKPDIAHHVAMKPVLFGSIAARAVGGGAVVNALAGLGFMFSATSTKARVLRAIVAPTLRFALSRARHVTIIQNEDDLRVLGEDLHVERQSIRLIRGAGVDATDYDLGDPPPGECLVVLPARMLRDKGVVEFVDAARRLRQRGCKARFALVGRPDPENPTTLSEAQLRAWHQEGVVEYWGWQADMRAVLARCHIVCLPSYREGLPKALLEAAAAGRPIVTTDATGCRDVVVHGESGLMVPVRDAERLAAALAALIADEPLRARMGACGRKMVQDRFSSQRVVAETLAVYAEMLVPR